MAKKFKIAWLPGDGVGIEVMEAARIVLDKVGLDAEYIHGDIGWEFWCKEGDAFPARTIESDVLLVGSRTEKVLAHNVTYADSDHHKLPHGQELYPPQYPHPGQ